MDVRAHAPEPDRTLGSEGSTGSARPPQRQSRPRARRLVFVLVTLGVIGCLFLPVAEGTLRLLAPQPESWLDAYRRHPALPFFALAPGLTRVVDTGETHWTVVTDGRGSRVGARTAKLQLAPRPVALVLGDSYTFGHGVDYELSFVGQLEQTTGLRYFNAAVPGYGPAQYRQVLEYELPRLPDKPALLLIGTFLGNDFHDCIQSKDEPIRDGVLGDTGDLKSRLKRSSHLYRLVSRVYHTFVPVQDQGTAALLQTFEPELWKPGARLHPALEIYEREMKRIAEIAAARGIALLVLVLPARPTVEARRGKPRAPGKDYEHPLTRARNILDSLHIAYVDVTPALAEHDASAVYYAHDGHLTPLGHRLVTRALAPAVQRLAMAPPQPGE